jgi:hypothetical protein
MDRRLGRIAGAAAVGLVIARLGRLFLGGPGAPPWPLILLASALLGGVAFWLLVRAFPTRPRLVVALFSLGALLLLFRVSVPDTLLAGLFPSSQTLPPLIIEMTEALRLIRHGIAPIVPTVGVVAILSVVLWTIGGFFAWGLTTGPTVALFLPSLTLYLQLAVSDRIPVGLSWAVSFVAVLGLGITALAMQRRTAAGLARDQEGRAVPRHTPYLAMALVATVGVGALVVTESASGLVPVHGTLDWRSGGTGYGPGGSGVAFNRLVDLKQRIISRTNQVLFRATLGPDSPPGDGIYWRMESLDEFDGTAWRRSSVDSVSYDPDLGVPAADDLYLGTTHRILHHVQIDNLRGEGVLPSAGVPLQLHELSVGENTLPTSSLLVLDDSTLVAPSGLQRGATYQLVASQPDVNADLGSLATGPDGQLTPLFAAAAAAGSFDPAPGPPPVPTEPPRELDRLTRLPDEVRSTLTNIARQRTRGAATDFERAWLLQHWFRDSGDFAYSTDVSTGHDSLVLEDWLTDSTSRNYRVGYCEQFAATMAILGRVLGIPTRVVWGFTPGHVEPQANGPDVVVVRDTNAHAWVEMWIDGFGWVSFDPTPRGEFQPPSPTGGFDPTRFVSQTGELGPLPIPEEFGPGDEGFQDSVDGESLTGVGSAARWWPLVILVLALVLAVSPVVKTVRRRRRLARLRRGDITAAWEEIVDRLTDLREVLPSAKTPLELARDIDAALVPLAVGYSAAVYGGRTGHGKESDLRDIEGWLHESYQGRRLVRAMLSPRSLTGRADQRGVR